MPKRNLAWILIVVAIALLIWQLPQLIAGRDSVLHAFGPLVDARAQIHRRYVKEPDDERLSRAAADAGIRAMVRELNDPYAVYLNPREFATFQARTDGRYGGIGVEVWTTDLGLEVLSREKGSPADVAGVLPGDLITHIDGEPIAQLPAIESVNHRLNGAAGADVTITVIRNDATAVPRKLDFEMKRAEIELDPVRGWSRDVTGGWRYLLNSESGIGYIRLVKFTSDVDERMGQEIQRLQSVGLRALVLDVRENSGGLLDSAWDVADKFLSSGLIVKTSGRKSADQQWYAMAEGTLPDFPMVVLVNRNTASAAEIVAGSLRDHKRAAVFGERTYGKGSVQELVPLPENGGAIKLTTRYYYLPNGERIHREPGMTEKDKWGVMPTRVITLTPSERTEWMRAWREVAREPNGTDEDGLTEDSVLAADRQLAEAVAYLIERVEPSKRDSTGAADNESGTKDPV
jgi:carboxyl-terminal processing protease